MNKCPRQSPRARDPPRFAEIDPLRPVPSCLSAPLPRRDATDPSRSLVAFAKSCERWGRVFVLATSRRPQPAALAWDVRFLSFFQPELRMSHIYVFLSFFTSEVAPGRRGGTRET